MPLACGARLGPYEILGLIGAGGMGEVYRATDTRLNRDVAVKVSHEAFSDRFSREASAVAALNHPNVCTLHDVGPNYLVMEFVEGAPLKGPLPVAQALRLADEILAALDHAHRKGIVHRDLKPANIMVTRQGIKLLDFGLAKVRPVTPADEMTVAKALTTEGVLLGTLQYMSPEQLEGQEADERSDIFSFGCVLYELLTGRRPFDAPSPAGLIAAILKSTPAPVEPAALNRVLQTCLARDPGDRWQSANELRHALRWTAGESPVTAPARPAPTARTAWMLAAITTMAAAIFGTLWLRQPVAAEPRFAFTIDAPPGAAFNFLVTATAVSPDGRFIVFRAGGNDLAPTLWLRPVDDLTAERLAGTEDGDFPFWSPDSRAIAFFAGDRLKTLDISGGAPVVIAEAVGGGTTWGTGGAWNRDGVILFGDTRGLIRMAASGGTPQVLVAADAAKRERGVAYPQFLPDGERFLYLLISDDPDAEGVYVSSLDNPSSHARILRTKNKAVFSPPVHGGPGHLLFVRDRSLVAQPFDQGLGRLEGEPAVIANDVSTHAGLNGSAFWSSDTGMIVYRAGPALERTRLSWISRAGVHLGAGAPDDAYSTFRLAPDARRLAFGRLEPSGPDDIWLLEFGSQRTTRFTFDSQIDTCPAWSRDGRQIAFSSARTGFRQIYRKDAGGGGQDLQLSEGPGAKCVTDWSVDGRQLLYAELGTSSDLWVLPLDGNRTPVPVIQSAFDETDGQFSPDGRWIAYTSNESGRSEVYVIANHGSGSRLSRWPVSNQGGRAARWRSDSRELYYLAADNRTIMAAEIRPSEDGVDPGTPRPLFTAPTPLASGYLRVPYDATGDGQRFLVQEATQLQSNPLTVVVNWPAAPRP